LPSGLTHVRLARGTGALRALLITAPPGTALRPLFMSIAAALAARTTHVLWTLIGSDTAGAEVGIGCWTAERRPPRVGALLARPGHIVASDAEALCALEAASVGEDLLVHTRWCELLGRDALSRRFYRTLEQRVDALARSLPRVPERDGAELALLAASRLLFLSFLQAKGWLDADRAFLANRFDECMARRGGFHQRVMLPLFFGTLNTPQRKRAATARRFGSIPFLNGGLFSKTALERRHSAARFSDAAVGDLFSQLLSAYRFTAREDQEWWSEVAIDPEMLGHAFESLMASRERRASGAFYTPQALVVHVADNALLVALAGTPLDEATLHDALRGKPLGDEQACILRGRLRDLTVLDPACGSGAFLVHVLDRLTHLHRAAGDRRSTAAIRRDVLAHCIYGVDINPTAVWLCELRLWLSVVIESDETRMSAVPPLPNLDCNVRIGDTLAGDGFADPPSLVGPSAVLARLRERYVRATGARKAPLRRALAREEMRRAIAAIDRELVALTAARHERLVVRRSPDLFGERHRETTDARTERLALRQRCLNLRRERGRIAGGGALPFSFPSHFGHVHARGGFQLIVGNPPWVRLHNIPVEARATLRARFTVYRDAAWIAGAGSTASHGFSAQVDLAALFLERSLALVAPAHLAAGGGAVALLLPAKLWRSLSGGGARRLVGRHSNIRHLMDWTDAESAFDAAVYPSVIIASRRGPAGDEAILGVRRRTLEVEWRAPPTAIRLDRDDDASPWLLMPPDVRQAFDRLRSRGHPLGESPLGRPTLGVKCGCNDAFVVEAVGGDRDQTIVRHQGREASLERSLVRPLLRGEAVAAWHVPPSRRGILWTHGPDGPPIRALPEGAARWLAPWR
ncbi:MAG: Eco57I restriction-modification methylase domain-containing protein, partial [Gemmatimonadaceae bacterium]